MLTFPYNFFVIHENALFGTEVAIVGILASCHPIPELRIFTPAFSISFARRSTSSQEEPFGIKSIKDSL